MSERDTSILVEDILESIERIKEYVGSLSFEEFSKDNKTIDAIIRNLEIVGEAANRISEVVKEKYPQIKWHQIVGLRNRVIHEYFGVDQKIIWHVVKNELDKLKSEISEILDN